MSKKLGVRTAMMVALLAAFGASNTAFAVFETETSASRNDSIGSAERLVIGDGGSVEVTGVLGTMDPAAALVDDLDFFSFQGTANDVVTIDIDGGMKAAGSGTRSVNTIVTIFRPDLTVLLFNNDASVDSGSVSFQDARIEPVVLPVDGIYYVAVSSFPRFLLDGGVPMRNDVQSNGSYSLIISGVTPPPALTYIGIDVKPGNRQRAAAFNPKSKGSIPVALLSSPTFKPLEAEQGSIRFGATGDEDSLLRCHKEGAYLNGDDIPDLVCHFDTQAAGFGPEDVAAVVKGKTPKGKFEGRGDLKILPAIKSN